jgi:hypothetical protein
MGEPLQGAAFPTHQVQGAGSQNQPPFCKKRFIGLPPKRRGLGWGLGFYDVYLCPSTYKLVNSFIPFAAVIFATFRECLSCTQPLRN